MADINGAASTTPSSFPFLPAGIQKINHSSGNETVKIEDSLENYDLYFQFKNLYIISPFVLLGIGGILNTLSFLVVVRPTLRRTSTGVYLAVLAISDTLVLLGNVITMLSNVHEVFKNMWFCRIVYFLTSWNSHVSTWMLVAMTTDRLIATAVPFKVNTLCRPKIAAIAIMLIVIFFAGLNLNILWTINVESDVGCVHDKENYTEFWKYFIWVDLSFYALIPGLVLVILNSIIIYKLWYSYRIQCSLTSGASRHNGHTDILQRQLTITLLLVTFAFIIFSLPHGIHVSLIYSASAFQKDIYNLEPYVEGLFRTQVYSVLLLLNHCLNFVFYCLGGRKFRQELCNLFRTCCIKMKCICVGKSSKKTMKGEALALPVRSTINTSYTSLNSTPITPTPSPKNRRTKSSPEDDASIVPVISATKL